MEEILKELLEEQKKTNNLLQVIVSNEEQVNTGKLDYDPLTLTGKAISRK